MEQLALEEAGIFHADRHTRQQHFQRARRRKVKTRPYLTQIGHRRVGTFRTGSAKAGDQTLCVVEIVVTDPSEWQVGKRNVVLGEFVEGYRVRRRVYRTLAGKQNSLGGACCTGRIKNDGRVRSLACSNFSIEP